MHYSLCDLGGSNHHRLVCAGRTVPAHPSEYSLGLKAANSVISASLQLCQKHKVGVLLCRAGQSTEEEMYNNEEASPAFSAFLELLGEQVLLKGFTKYAAQLDTKSESCQRQSLFSFIVIFYVFKFEISRKLVAL